MKWLKTGPAAVLSVALIIGLAYAQNTKQAAPATKKPAAGAQAEQLDPKQQAERVSYGIGLNIGQNLKEQPFEIDTKVLIKGLQDGLAGGEPQYTQDQIQAAMMALQEQVTAKVQKDAAAQAEKGKQFLAENAKKQGVKTTKSGLQYEIIKEGTGATPKPTDMVTTHYEGTLVDGKVFDSSIKRGEPVSFPVNGVIAGWTEALQLMKEGAKWKLYIPANLAYGEEGRPGIPPNAPLIFDIELISIDKLPEAVEAVPATKK